MKITKTWYNINNEVLYQIDDITKYNKNTTLPVLARWFSTKEMQFVTYFKNGIEKSFKRYELEFDEKKGILKVTYNSKSLWLKDVKEEIYKNVN